MYINRVRICISWYSKLCWFSIKNGDVSRTQDVCHVIHIVFRSSLGKVWLCHVLSLFDMCDSFQEGSFFVPFPTTIYEQPPKRPSWIGLRLKTITEKIQMIRIPCSSIYTHGFLWSSAYEQLKSLVSLAS